MKFLAGITLLLIFTVACSGSGGFTNGFKLGKKTEKKDDNKGGEDLGKETNSSTTEDTADQPVQITGTYLTCSETEANDTQATFGCRLARKDNGKTAGLSEVGSDWTFDYEILNGLPGSVLVKKTAGPETYQVFYEFEASSRSALKTLIKNTRISLNIDLLPGAGVETGSPEFSGLIVTFVPQGQSEIVSGTQTDLSDNIVNSASPASETPQTQVANPPVVNPAPTPSPATNPPVVAGPVPGNPPVTPVDTAKPEDSVPSTQSVASEKPAEDAESTDQEQAMSDKDPVVTFSLEEKSPGVFALKAAFDQSAGLSGATFSGGTTAVSFIGALIGSSGSATLGLTTPVNVSVKKGTKTCSGSDTIGAGKIRLPLTCK